MWEWHRAGAVIRGNGSDHRRAAVLGSVLVLSLVSCAPCAIGHAAPGRFHSVCPWGPSAEGGFGLWAYLPESEEGLRGPRSAALGKLGSGAPHSPFGHAASGRGTRLLL